MPIYFLHVKGSNGLIRDVVGSRLSKLEAPRLEAIVSARELMVDSILTEGVSESPTAQKYASQRERGCSL